MRRLVLLRTLALPSFLVAVKPIFGEVDSAHTFRAAVKIIVGVTIFNPILATLTKSSRFFNVSIALIKLKV